MNHATRVRRDMLRERRRHGAGLTVYDLRAGMNRPDSKLALTGLRIRLLLQRYSMGDGIAYISYDALAEHAPAPRSGAVPAGIVPVPSGLPPAPLNAAYWVEDDDQDEYQRTVFVHDYSGDCPTCGPCEFYTEGGIPVSCGCCACDQDEEEAED